MRILWTALIATLLLPGLSTAQTLERIKETGQMDFGFRTDAAPLSFLAENQPQGYTPTVCYELAAKMGAALGLTEFDIVFHAVTTEDRFERVASGEIDLLCGAATETLSRREIVDFSIPVYVDGATVAMKKDAPQSFAALAGQKIGVRSGTTTEEALQNSLKSMDIEAEIVQFDNHPAGMEALETDAIQAYFADQSILMNMVLMQPDPTEFLVLEEILTVEKQALAMARGDTAFRLAVDRGLSQLFQDGTMRRAFDAKIPGAEAGLALQAMFLLSPTLP